MALTPILTRETWIDAISSAWKKAPIVWLSGVRRAGKTTLAKSLNGALYLNCDLPSVQIQLEDPEIFFRSVKHEIVIFDEIHQIKNPDQILKIAADEFPHIKILATGSSTLAATQKFKDTLTGRKRSIHLLPVLYDELQGFGIHDIRDRLFRGGLPQALLSSEKDNEFYNEWIDSFYARDIQELFKVEKRNAFLQLLQLLLKMSGSLIEITNLSKNLEISRPTVMNYLSILEITHVIYTIRPFHKGGIQEITHQPKIYGFDTGFVSFARGWESLRPDDCGLLWEGLVLETLLSIVGRERVFYWRDKQKREVDFIIPHSRDSTVAIECKWNSSQFDPTNLKAYREWHPKGKNYVVAQKVTTRSHAKYGDLKVKFIRCNQLREILEL